MIDGMLQKQQEEMQQPQQMQQQNLQQHLTQLRTWDLSAGQSMEQRRTQQKDLLLQRHQEDIGWLKQFYTNLAPAQAAGTAPGQPLQECHPQKLSQEGTRKNAAKRKAAKRHHPEANESSYDIVAALAQRKAEVGHSLDTVGGMKAFHGHGYDSRVLMDFCQGHKVDKAGKPANEEEARKMQEDKKFLEDYDSKDAQRRKPHLDRMVDEILRIEVQEWMFDAPYVLEHAAELRAISQKILLIDNIKKDNPEYFEQLKANAPLKYALLEAQNYMGPGMSTKLMYAFQTRCVDLNSDTYLDVTDSPANYIALQETAPQFFAESCRQLQESAKTAVQTEIDKRIAQRRQEIARQREEIEKDDSLAAQKVKKAGLTADNKPDSAATVLKYQDMILNNRERYAPNETIVDMAYAELFKAIDTKDDLMTQIRCTLEYGEDFDQGAAGFDTVQKYVGTREAELKEIVKNISVQIECLENLLKHILRGDQLEASGTVAATRFGYHQQIENLPRTDLDDMENTQYRSTMLDEQGQEQVTFYTKEDQNITLSSSAIKKETVRVKDSETQEEKNEAVEIAQTSAQYSYAYKTQASAMGRLLWMGNPPHAELLLKTHAKLSALGSKMYEPIEIKGKDKQARLESAGDQIAALQDEIGAAIESCEDYVKQKFGFGKAKKAARALVEETLKTLREDYKKLDGRIAQLMYRAVSGEMTFGELLGDARATVIDLDREKEKLGKAGANMSDVITVGEGAEKLFYKEEETIHTNEDVFRQKFMSSREDQQRYGKLLTIIRDTQNILAERELECPNLYNFTSQLGQLVAGYAQAAETGNFEVQDRKTQMLAEDYTAELAAMGISLTELPVLLREISPEFVKQMIAFENMTYNAKISAGSKIALRNVATSRMASLLGAGNLVAKSKTSVVQEKGKQQRKGIVMERARGQAAATMRIPPEVEKAAEQEKNHLYQQARNAYAIAKNQPGADMDKVKQDYNQAMEQAKQVYQGMLDKVRAVYTPDAVRQLVNLHLLDLICGQTDRHLNNYFVTTNRQGRIDSIQGIDNDVAFGELLGEDIKTSNGFLLGMSSMNLPVVDQEMYDTICSLTSEVIEVNFADLLSQKEIHALVDRIRSVREYLTDRIEKGELIAVEKGQWTEEHTEKFKGKYVGYVDKQHI